MAVRRQAAAARQERLEGTSGTLLDGTGEFVTFVGRTLAAGRDLAHFGAEALRQAAIIASGSLLILMVASFAIGAGVGQLAFDNARGLGVEQFAAVATGNFTTVSVMPFLFSFILAAKVACGFAAEIGAMSVREEVDVVESLGIPAMVYLVATRFFGAMVVLPFIYLVSVATSYLGVFTQRLRYPDVSAGAFELYFYNFQHPTDLLIGMAQVMVTAFFVLTVALFFGWRTSGGPVEVGQATARTMAVSLVLIMLVHFLFTLLFGIRPLIPLA